MRTLELRSELPASAEEIYEWHARPGAFERLNPPWDPVTVVRRTGRGLGVGVEIELSVPLSPMTLVSRHVAHHSPEDLRRGGAAWAGFVDEQQRGPFASWRHEHRFTDGRLVDAIEFEGPLGLAGGLLERRVRRMFAFRHARTRIDLERHAPLRDRPRMQVLIAGGTGLLGRELAAFLGTGGHDVRLLSRRPGGPQEPFTVVPWDPERGPLDPAAVDGVDVVVNLAGEAIAGRWTAARKRSIERSRVQTTDALAQAIRAARARPRLLLSGSAVGWYGDRGEDEVTEDSPSGQGFLAEVARRWEAAAAAAGARTVYLRTGIVLSARGGYLGALLPLARLGALGPTGSGRQWMPWIAIDDWIGAAHLLMWREDVEGPVNVVGPSPVRQRDLAAAIGRVLGRPAFLPTPAAAVSLALGSDAARELVLAGQRAAPSRLRDAGFPFAHPDLEAALRFELGR